MSILSNSGVTMPSVRSVCLKWRQPLKLNVQSVGRGHEFQPVELSTSLQHFTSISSWRFGRQLSPVPLGPLLVGGWPLLRAGPLLLTGPPQPLLHWMKLKPWLWLNYVGGRLSCPERRPGERKPQEHSSTINRLGHHRSASHQTLEQILHHFFFFALPCLFSSSILISVYHADTITQ